MPSLLDAASGYYSVGFNVFPTKPFSKTPLIKWKELQSRRLSINEMTSFWGHGKEAGIAVVLGTISGNVLVVDIDKRSGGLETMKTLCLPDTFTTKTGGGGFHYFYRYTGALRKAIGTKPGIDLIADGGYCILPPSIHESGQPYEIFKNLPIASAPAWIYNLQNKPALIPVGRRHASILRSIRGYAADTKFSFIFLWKRAYGLTAKYADLPSEDPFTFGELFEMCLWSWNATHPHDRKTHEEAWKMLFGRARDTGDIVFGSRDARITNSFHPKNVNTPTTQTTQLHNVSESIDINTGEIEIPFEEE